MQFYIFEGSLEINANRKDDDILFDFSLPDVFIEITYTAKYSHTITEKIVQCLFMS